MIVSVGKGRIRRRIEERAPRVCVCSHPLWSNSDSPTGRVSVRTRSDCLPDFCRHTRVYTFHIQPLSSPNMARATRSSATQDKDKPHDPPQAQRKNAKKRKRTSIADSSEQPALKQPRTDDDIKEEDEQKPLDTFSHHILEINLPSTGDVPIQPEDAEKILQVLSVCVPSVVLVLQIHSSRFTTTGSIPRVFLTGLSLFRQKQLIQAPQQPHLQPPFLIPSVISCKMLLIILCERYEYVLSLHASAYDISHHNLGCHATVGTRNQPPLSTKPA